MQDPYIKPSEYLPEISWRAVILGIFLAMVLGASNAYLALKAGQTITACIPAAVVSMILLRKTSKKSNILENNMVQTIASAGEAVAAGIVFTLPALVIMGFWNDFCFWETACIGFLGGVLGVFFSIPLRQAFIVKSSLRFPEGVATAAVLKTAENTSDKSESGAKEIVRGGIIAALFKLGQTGFHIFSDSIHYWVTLSKGMTCGIGTGISFATMGAGYVVGWKASVAIALGAFVSWIIGVPLYTFLNENAVIQMGTSGYDLATAVWSQKLRFVGVGAFVVGGIWTVLGLMPQIKNAIVSSFKGISTNHEGLLRTEKDIPMPYLLTGTGILVSLLFLFFKSSFATGSFRMDTSMLLMVTSIAVIFCVIIGFLSSCVSSYMTGVVGSSSNPLSGIVIMGVLLISGIFYTVFKGIDFHMHGIKIAGMIMMLASVVACIAVIGGENLQDLKSGHILGATPWKQELMLIIGVLVGSLAISPVLKLLYEAYGLTGAMPRPDMDPSHAMSAPKAALMAELIKGVFTQTIDWVLYGIGAGIAVFVMIIDTYLKSTNASIRLPILAVALGIYLPFDVSTSIFLGGCVSFFSNKWFIKQHVPSTGRARAEQKGTLFSSGLIAGEAIMGVLLAMPFALLKNNNIFSIGVIANSPNIVLGLTLLCFVIGMHYFYKSTKNFR